MAGFVQLIEFEASDIDAMNELIEKFRKEHPGVMTQTAARATADRDRPGTYVSIVEFDSYESAMEQSNNPELMKATSELAKLMDGPPRFRNLDVRHEF